MTQASFDHKTASTQYPVISALRNRWSPRAFNNQPITPDDLHTIFEAASWAPSAINEQPWLYIYAHRSDEAGFQKLVDCLLPGNQVWAKNAAVLILSLARKNHSATGKPNHTYLYDTGAANMALTIQATEMGIHVHQMGGFDHEVTIKAFNLADDVQPAVIMALGYQGSHEQLDEPFRTRELAARSRKPLSEIVTKAS